MNTTEVLKRHVDALLEGDIDKVMADYGEDSVLCSAQGAARGLAAIRAVFEPFVAKVLPPGSQFKIQSQVVDGDIAFITWTGESPRFRIPFGTDSFVIRGGRIVAQTAAMQIEKK